MKLKIVALIISVGSFAVLSGQLRRVPLFSLPGITALENPDGTLSPREYRRLRCIHYASAVVTPVAAVAALNAVRAAGEAYPTNVCSSFLHGMTFIAWTKVAQAAVYVSMKMGEYFGEKSA